MVTHRGLLLPVEELEVIVQDIQSFPAAVLKRFSE
jgi:hypothetical protein